MINPIIQELKKLKLINPKKIVCLNNRTRDKKVRVLKDPSGIIFLEKNLIDDGYYNFKKDKDDTTPLYEKQKRKSGNIKTLDGNIKIPIIEDYFRRATQFKKILKNKDVLDFGCGWGGFLKNVKNAKSLSGVDLRKECIDYIQHKLKKINISNNINSFNKNFDVITMFHVLEHIPYQVDTMKFLKSKLKNKGKIIVEVPHARDFLILQDELKEFKNFTFCAEHLITHTSKSLKTILSKSGFKNIKIQYFQRYNLSNHLGWFLKRKPGGHNFYNKIVSDRLNLSYCENLVKLKQTDTIIAIAEKI